jgi:hypothetical protein
MAVLFWRCHYFFDYFEKFPKSILHKFRRYVLSLQ